jgi:hypothetical protein
MEYPYPDLSDNVLVARYVAFAGHFIHPSVPGNVSFKAVSHSL